MDREPSFLRWAEGFQRLIPGPVVTVWLFPQGDSAAPLSEAIKNLQQQLASLSGGDYWTSILLEAPIDCFGAKGPRQTIPVGGIVIARASGQEASLRRLRFWIEQAGVEAAKWGELTAKVLSPTSPAWQQQVFRLIAAYPAKYLELTPKGREWIGLLLNVVLTGRDLDLWGDCERLVPVSGLPPLPIVLLEKLRDGRLPGPPPSVLLPNGQEISGAIVSKWLQKRLESFPPPWPVIVELPDFAAASARLCSTLAQQAARPAKPRETEPEGPEFAFYLDGEVWYVRAYGKEGRFRQMKGFAFLYRLISAPDYRMRMADLIDPHLISTAQSKRNKASSALIPRPSRANEDEERSGEGASMQIGEALVEMADKETIRKVREELENIEERIKETQLRLADQEFPPSWEERAGLEERLRRLQEDQTKTEQYLRQAIGYRGRKRHLPTLTDKRRSLIHHALQRAYNRLRQAEMRKLALHFQRNVKASGVWYRYTNPLPWRTSPP